MQRVNNSITYGQCRCCLALGYHRHMLKEYYRDTVQEVYYNIFAECFNLYLSTNSTISMLICNKCIERLHDASTFKALAIQSEQCLLSKAGGQDMLCVNVPAVEEIVEVKLEFKEEPNEKRDLEDKDVDHEDVDHDYLPYGDDGNQKEELDKEENKVLYELRDHKRVLPKRKYAISLQRPARQHFEAAMSSNILIPEAKKFLSQFRIGDIPPLPMSRAALKDMCPAFAIHLQRMKDKTITLDYLEELLKSQKRRKDLSIGSEKQYLVANICNIIENSNVTPFRFKKRSAYPCYYCKALFDNLTGLRDHQKSFHKKSELKNILAMDGPESLIVHVDVTDLKCTICEEKIKNLTELKSHLIKKHNKKFYSDVTDRVVPYKLSENNIFECQVCGFSFETFGSIERHMNVHYRNYVCNECGSGYVTKYRLKVHAKSMHVEGSYQCEHCKKVFASQQKLKNHTNTVHKMFKRFKCPKCPERFFEYFARQRHLVGEHGAEPLRYKCNVCDRTFDRRFNLSRHMKRDHLEEKNFKCEMCAYKCFSSNELQVHMIKHNGERIHECTVCKKAYARKKTLAEHMRIHNDDRRFACSVCGQAFVQKCSLKGHMKTHHKDHV